MAGASIAALPHAVVASVFSYVSTEEQRGDSSFSLPPALVPLALVSREWHALACDVQSQQFLQTLHVVSWAKTRQDVLNVRRQLTLRRRALRRLAIFDWSTSGLGLWTAALALVPELTTLRVYGVDVGYASVQLLEIVRAAGRHCPRIDRLELPPFVNKKTFPSYPAFPRRSSETDDDENDDECPPLDPVKLDSNAEEPVIQRSDPATVIVNAVFQSADEWKQRGRAGLRHLCFSAHEVIKDVPSANSYVSALATNCPQLQVLEGCEGMHERGGSGEKWTIDLATWRDFCHACSHLTTFTWLSVPFASRFFEIFGEFKKPGLTKLVLATTERWNWSMHLSGLDIDDRQALIEAGYGPTARNAHAVLRSCPNLTDLEIQCFFSTGATNIMDVDQFGDVFCEALATHCPQLTTLAMRPRYGYWTRPGSIMTMTDRSMAALAQLPLLSKVMITGANVTGDGLYTLVMDHARASNAIREFDIRIGHVYDGPELVDAMLFYRILASFLDRLASETRDLAATPRRVQLRLVNEGGGRLDDDGCVEYLVKNQERRAMITTKHPTVTVQQADRGFDGRGIREFLVALNL